jgi:hypothetical protein
MDPEEKLRRKTASEATHQDLHQTIQRMHTINKWLLVGCVVAFLLGFALGAL